MSEILAVFYEAGSRISSKYIYKINREGKKRNQSEIILEQVKNLHAETTSFYEETCILL